MKSNPGAIILQIGEISGLGSLGRLRRYRAAAYALLWVLVPSAEATSLRTLNIVYPAEFCCPPGFVSGGLPRKRIAFVGQKALDNAVSKYFRVARVVSGDVRDEGTSIGVLSLRLTSFVISTPASSHGFGNSGKYRATLEMDAELVLAGGRSRERWMVKASSERDFPEGLQSWRIGRATRVARAAFRDAAAAVVRRLTLPPYERPTDPS